VNFEGRIYLKLSTEEKRPVPVHSSTCVVLSFNMIQPVAMFLPRDRCVLTNCTECYGISGSIPCTDRFGFNRPGNFVASILKGKLDVLALTK
jgi:hypothetical protein